LPLATPAFTERLEVRRDAALTSSTTGKAMTSTAQAPRNTIFNGDCIDVMQSFDTGSIDFILTDPPYVIHCRDRQDRSQLLRLAQAVPLH